MPELVANTTNYGSTHLITSHQNGVDDNNKSPAGSSSLSQVPLYATEQTVIATDTFQLSNQSTRNKIQILFKQEINGSSVELTPKQVERYCSAKLLNRKWERKHQKDIENENKIVKFDFPMGAQISANSALANACLFTLNYLGVTTCKKDSHFFTEDGVENLSVLLMNSNEALDKKSLDANQKKHREALEAYLFYKLLPHVEYSRKDMIHIGTELDISNLEQVMKEIEGLEIKNISDKPVHIIEKMKALMPTFKKNQNVASDIAEEFAKKSNFLTIGLRTIKQYFVGSKNKPLDSLSLLNVQENAMALVPINIKEKDKDNVSHILVVMHDKKVYDPKTGMLYSSVDALKSKLPAGKTYEYNISRPILSISKKAGTPYLRVESQEMYNQDKLDEVKDRDFDKYKARILLNIIKNVLLFNSVIVAPVLMSLFLTWELLMPAILFYLILCRYVLS